MSNERSVELPQRQTIIKYQSTDRGFCHASVERQTLRKLVEHETFFLYSLCSIRLSGQLIDVDLREPHRKLKHSLLGA